MLALAVARADRVIVPTVTVAGTLADLVAVAENVMVSPWGVDHLPNPSPVPVPGVSGPYLLYVGQARPHKGLTELLTALSVRRGTEVLVLAGRDFTPGGAAARSATEALGSDGVVALGEVSDAALARLYRGAAALVHLAAHEGFGFPPLEALAHGCPVLAADIPVLQETLGSQASFADHNDPGHIATQLEQLIATDTSASRWRSMLISDVGDVLHLALPARPALPGPVRRHHPRRHPAAPAAPELYRPQLRRAVRTRRTRQRLPRARGT